VSNPWIDLDGYFKLELPGDYEAGNSIVCDGKTINFITIKEVLKRIFHWTRLFRN